ncbi:DUF937 domain-containing protein [Arthrobacter sp. UYCo732]|uniref:DUF937 domain-containing protein n=1 Tax=Arthrobacter sp. UYCo732 TaxID=3156336 RepID=UPI003396D196
MCAAQVDTADGEKIVGHVFGGQQDYVAAQLAGTSGLGGVGGDLIRKALPILAPIVMSYLAKRSSARAGKAPAGQGRPAELAAGRLAASTSAAFWAESSAQVPGPVPVLVLVLVEMPEPASRVRCWTVCWAVWRAVRWRDGGRRTGRLTGRLAG